jgi:hypothetical protein
MIIAPITPKGSGRSETSRFRRPLRTVQTSFPVHGSSSSVDEYLVLLSFNRQLDLKSVEVVPPAIQCGYVYTFPSLFNDYSTTSSPEPPGRSLHPFRLGIALSDQL